MEPLSLVCPGCRMVADERIHVRTLAADGDVLACACGRRYPVVDGVPIVLADVGDFMRTQAVAVLERDLPASVASLLAGGGDDAPYARLLEHLSIYLDAHWGTPVTPDGGADSSDLRAAGLHALKASPVLDRLAQLPHVGRAVELGCSVGRVVAELAKRADQVVGVELQFAAVRRARRLLAGERLAYCRRELGQHYRAAFATGLATPNAILVCGDALDPPLVPRGFDRVVAINVLDSVASPRQLLAVIDGLLPCGGEVILASPYQWQSTVMADAERLGGDDPAAVLRAILVAGHGLDGRYTLEDEAELPWILRQNARSTLTYQVHYLRARKL